MKKLSEVVAEVEKEHIKKVLKENKYNIQRTSRDLDIARNTLKERIKRYKLM